MPTDVFVAPGHGIRPSGVDDPGTVDPATGADEGSASVAVVRHVLAALDRCGIDHDHEPLDGTDPNYVGTITAVNAGAYRCAVEVHYDWSRAPRGGFGIYVSEAGRRLAASIAHGYRRRDLPLRYDGTYADTRGLSFLRRTRPPAVIWECDRIGAYGPGHALTVGEAIAEGIAGYLGRPWVPPGPPRRRFAVVVAALAEPDTAYASIVGTAHGFAVATLDHDAGEWRAIRAHGAEPGEVIHPEYVVAFGRGADTLVEVAGDGVTFTGANRAATEALAVDLIRDPQVPRRRPWAR